MADNETSKIVWIAIVVALAATIYFFARPQIHDLAKAVFDKVGALVNGIDLKAPETNVKVPAPGGLITGIFG